MSKIFAVLAVTSLTLIAANLLLGFSIAEWPALASDIRDSNEKISALKREEGPDAEAALITARAAATQKYTDSQPIRARVLVHMLLGISAGIGAVLVNSISVTYFVGTSRWCKEVVEAYSLNPNYVAESTSLKRRTWPWAVLGMLTVVVMVALGGAADPGNSLTNPAEWATWHRLAALVGMAFIGISFWLQFNNIVANYVIIQKIMAEVKQVRRERGLLV